MIRSEIDMLKLEFGIDVEIPVSPEENAKFKQMYKAKEQLPDDIVRVKDEGSSYFARIRKSNLSDGEMMQLLHLKQLKAVETTKAWTIFFGVIFTLAFITLIIINAQ